MRRALFPGSFDPITLGHTEIIERSRELFDEVVVGVGRNTSKVTMFTVEQRVDWICQYFAHEPRLKVEAFDGLTVQFAQQIEARFLIRGLRSSPDFEYEKTIHLLNRHLNPKVDTIFLVSEPATNHISSTLVREIIRFRGSLDGLVPPLILPDIYPAQPGENG